MKHALLAATGNKGKLAELRMLLADLPIEVLGPEEAFRSPPTVVEDGATFIDNAMKKARAYATSSMMLTLADDSGLEVDALGGAPGVRSARYAHERATDGENRSALLTALDAVGFDDPPSVRGMSPADLARAGSSPWTARFRCVLALIDPFADGAAQTAEGACEGCIVRTPRGSGGFGYDPLFLVAGTERTMAELTAEEKNRVSHRGRALVAMRPHLIDALNARTRRIATLFR